MSEPAREHFPLSVKNLRGNKCDKWVWSESGDKLAGRPVLTVGVWLLRALNDLTDLENGVPSPVLKHGPRSQTDTQGGRYRCQYFSRTERVFTHGVHTSKMLNTNRSLVD